MQVLDNSVYHLYKKKGGQDLTGQFYWQKHIANPTCSPELRLSSLWSKSKFDEKKNKGKLPVEWVKIKVLKDLKSESTGRIVIW